MTKSIRVKHRLRTAHPRPSGCRPATLVVMLLSACAQADPATTSATIRDSMGVRIAENQTAAWSGSDAWRLSPLPILSVGGEGGEPALALFNVRGALRLRGGGVLVANAGSHQLRFYDPSGDHVRDVGAHGSGPGEFRALHRIWRYRGDSILAFDIRQMVLSLFDSSGAFIRAIRLEVTRDAPLPIPIDVFADGSVLGLSATEPQTEERLGLTRGQMTLGEWSSSGSFTRALGTFPGREMFYFMSERGPYPNTPLLARRGEALSVGNRFIVASNAHYELRTYSRLPQLEAIARKPHVSARPTSGDVATLTALTLDWAPNESMRREMEKELEVMPVHEKLPAFGWPALPDNFSRRAILVDEVDHVWVLEYQVPGENPIPWSVFAPDGSFLGTLEVPSGFEVLEVGDHYIIGVRRDELGVETVQMYSLAKPDAEGAG